jgi:outer membrane receptor protein involved in Fe transport
VGDAWHQGIELASEADVVGAWDCVRKTDWAARVGSLSPFLALTLLDAEFDQGPNKGKSPQYAPDYHVRTGVHYGFDDRVKLGLLGTLVDDHYADDALTPSRAVPSYKVWDLTGEVVLAKNLLGAAELSLFGGINNLFDENYYARITGAGIDPADDRNYYGGFKISLGLPGEIEKNHAPKPVY